MLIETAVKIQLKLYLSANMLDYKSVSNNRQRNLPLSAFSHGKSGEIYRKNNLFKYNPHRISTMR